MSKNRQALDTNNPVVKNLGLGALFSSYDERKSQQDKQSIPSWANRSKDGKHIYTTPPRLGQYLVDRLKLLYFKRGIKETLYIYDEKSGLWTPEPQQQIDRIVTQKLNSIDDWSSRKMKDTTTFILSSVKAADASYTIDSVIDPDKVHFANGVYSFSNDEILPHSPNNYFARGRNYSIKLTEQPTPNTDKWLLESVGPDGFRLLMQYIGYLFYRTNKTWQALVILLADGGDGKSTFFNWLDELIGDDNVSTQTLENLTSNKNRFALSRLVGMSLNYDADISNDLIQKPDQLKKVTGNDRIDVEEKGKAAYKVQLFTKLMFAANDLPAFTDNSRGFKRRAIIIPFHRIDDFNQRYSLKKIYDEIPKFAYKCIRAFWEVHQQDEIKTSPEMDKLKDEWSGANNHVQEFANDYCVIKKGAREKKVYVYQAYRTFCNDNGYKPLSSVQFKKELERLETEPRIYDKTAKIGNKAYKCYINIQLVKAEQSS